MITKEQMAEAYIQTIENRIKALLAEVEQLNQHVKECKESLTSEK